MKGNELLNAILGIALQAMAAQSAITTNGAQLPEPEHWLGMPVRNEHRCTPFRARDYATRLGIKRSVAARLHGAFSPYTAQAFDHLERADVDHIVALTEAHDSGLCAAPSEVKRRFANDPENLTLADPLTNRHLKNERDAAQWAPQRSRCWFAQRIVSVKQRWRLAVDRAERRALAQILIRCPRWQVPPETPGTTAIAWDDSTRTERAASTTLATSRLDTVALNALLTRR